MIGAFVGFLCVAPGVPVAAEECALKQLEKVDYTEGPHGSVLVPMTFGDFPVLMKLDSGGGFSAIDKELADSLGVERDRLTPGGGVMYLDGANEELRDYARVSDFQIGRLKYSTPIDFLVIPGLPKHPKAPHYRGLIGLNLLRAYDVEIDFVGKKVAFFSQKHCHGQVVYWANEWVELPLKRRQTHSFVTVGLDGKDVEAMVDTGADVTVLSLSRAKDLFGLTPSSPGMKPDGTVVVMSGAQVKAYTYTFKKLDISGIAIQNPLVHIIDVEGESDELILGIDKLKHLRLYFAYGENKIYATSADAGL
jgi:predicted aspartyl protease